VSSFASESLRVLRRVIRGSGSPAPHAGTLQVLDGVSAVAALEARVCDIAGLGASYPAALAARVWASHETGLHLNAMNAPITGIDADSPRAALATAMGAAMAGRRATVFLSGPDILQCRDLLAEAAGRKLPMVVHAVLRAGSRHAQAIGTGHEAYHALDGIPALRFLAVNVQEAIDLATIARRGAELALMPAVVAMDAEQTALAVQSVAMPDDELLREFLGSASDVIPPATPAQRVLFGDTRRRVPPIYDLERPAALGTLQGPEAWALGAVAGRAFFDGDINRILAECAEAYAAQTDRRHDPIRTHRTRDAKIVLVAQGSMVETAESVADWVRANDRLKVGVIGVRHAWPHDAAALADALEGADMACVLERVACSADDDGPLMRQVRAVLDRCRENATHGPETHAGLPSLSPQATPRLIGAAAGLGGLPVNAADLLQLARELASPKQSFHYLGLDLVQTSSAYPKHQALMDALGRDFPGAAALGMRDRSNPPAPTLQQLTTLAVVRHAGRTYESFAGQLVSLAYGFIGGHVRSRPGISWQRAEQRLVDRVSFSPTSIADPGDDVSIDIAVLANASEAMPTGLTEGATILTTDHDAAEATLHSSGHHLCAVPVGDDDPGSRREALLGGALRLLLQQTGAEIPGEKQARAKRAEMLAGLTESEREPLLAAFVAGYEGTSPCETPSQRAAPTRATQEAAIPRDVADLPRPPGSSSLSRFWDHTGVFYKNGAMNELIAEPGTALGTTPALSSVFRDAGRGTEMLPVFVPAECNGSPELWTTCPDGSIAALAISPRALLDAGIDLATRSGAQADALRPVLGQLAKRAAKLAASDTPTTTAAEFFSTAFEGLLAKLSPAEDRAASLNEAFAAVIEHIGDLQIAVTDVFFREPERASPGTGALFALAINPDACKCPELIATRCRDSGIELTERTPEAVAHARRGWALGQALPDTAGDIIEHARKDPRVGALPAMMLSRHCLHAMVPGDGAEAGSGAKLALRRVLAIAEFHYQPRTQKLVGQIGQLRATLSARIQEQLASALPTGDLDALSRGLETLGRGDVELSSLSAKIDSAIVSGNVDGELLGRLVDVARGLADLEWRPPW
jgi:pyruvate-ferredoxin/flavodoxin oxidoreductase